MNILRTSLITLAALGLSAAAQAGPSHGHDHARGKHRWERPAQHRVIVAQPRCKLPQRVVYKPARHRHVSAPQRCCTGPSVVIRPGFQVQIALGY